MEHLIEVQDTAIVAQIEEAENVAKAIDLVSSNMQGCKILTVNGLPYVGKCAFSGQHIFDDSDYVTMTRDGDFVAHALCDQLPSHVFGR